MLKRFLVATALVSAGLFSVPAHAQSFITYVGRTGDNTNNCSMPTSPCATLQGAHDQTAINGLILCLDAVNTGSLLITKSLDIDCTGTQAGVKGGSVGDQAKTAQVVINVAVNANDPKKLVRLRGLSLNGANVVNRGISIVSASAVFLENVVVSDFTEQGILDRRPGGPTKLFIKDSIVSNSGIGIALGSQGPNTNLFDNVALEYNSYGIAAGNGNNVVINRSVMSGNSIAGVEGDGGAQLVVNNSVISHNSTGVQSNSSVRLFSNEISFNSTAITGASASLGQNRFSGNSALGTAPTPVAGASANIGP
ncbi:MAG TPA: right-handed parallel beta-helix repeat-containing protein [Bradyrhizobium sp.]|nr:right-handed parallel beta-helix repeat-containing protein [Bradyrhizobium sp.]